MSLRRILAGLATFAVAATLAVVAPATANAATCAAAYSPTQVYTGGMTASYNSHNWQAKWWTQGEAPSTGGSGVWADQGACDGGSGGGGGGTTCNYPDWVAGANYVTGALVRYPANGQYQTCGVIEKDFPDGPKQHRFVRAETHPSLDDAIQFAVTKGKQIVDQQGDRMFA